MNIERQLGTVDDEEVGVVQAIEPVLLLENEGFVLFLVDDNELLQGEFEVELVLFILFLEELYLPVD